MALLRGNNGWNELELTLLRRGIEHDVFVAAARISTVDFNVEGRGDMRTELRADALLLAQEALLQFAADCEAWATRPLEALYHQACAIDARLAASPGQQLDVHIGPPQGDALEPVPGKPTVSVALRSGRIVATHSFTTDPVCALSFATGLLEELGAA